MLTIETAATIGPDGTLTAKVPPYVPRGPHHVVITLDEAVLSEAPSPGLPDLAAFRESLGCAPYARNSFIEYRGDERS